MSQVSSRQNCILKYNAVLCSQYAPTFQTHMLYLLMMTWAVMLPISKPGLRCLHLTVTNAVILELNAYHRQWCYSWLRYSMRFVASKGPVVHLKVGWTMNIRWHDNWQEKAGVPLENIVPLLVTKVSLLGNGDADPSDMPVRIYQTTPHSFSYSPHTELQILITFEISSSL